MTKKHEPYYQDEFVTLYNLDSSKAPELWEGSDVLVTDPPYGINHRDKRTTGKTTADRTRGSQERIATGQTYKVTGDHSTEARDQILEIWGAEKPALVFGTWRRPRPANTRQLLIWHKDYEGFPLTPEKTHPWLSKTEEIYVLGRSQSQFGMSGVRSNYYRTDISGWAQYVGNIGHPTPKPIELMEDLISKCPPGLIVDPFAGSGSTLIAAKNLRRKAIGFEINAKYCELAARRLTHDVLDFGAIA